MRRQILWGLIGAIATVAIIVGLWGDRRADDEAAPIPTDKMSLRHALFQELQPVALSNCELERFGETHDGGYLMCANLLGAVESAYSYGIAGYDKWGCDTSTRLRIPLHQYDCFDTKLPACSGAEPVFHIECVGGATKTDDGGRLFDTIQNQIRKNGDAGKRIVLKIDVEGAEWESFSSTPDDTLNRIDQLVVEFHFMRESNQWIEDGRYLTVLRRLKKLFHIAHLHFNNAGCIGGLEPFPTWAYEVLFVNKRLGRVDPSGTVVRPHRLDAPNNPRMPACQA